MIGVFPFKLPKRAPVISKRTVRSGSDPTAAAARLRQAVPTAIFFVQTLGLILKVGLALSQCRFKNRGTEYPLANLVWSG
jgi:hypothetical protein